MSSSSIRLSKSFGRSRLLTSATRSTTLASCAARPTGVWASAAEARTRSNAVIVRRRLGMTHPSSALRAPSPRERGEGQLLVLLLLAPRGEGKLFVSLPLAPRERGEGGRRPGEGCVIKRSTTHSAFTFTSSPPPRRARSCRESL